MHPLQSQNRVQWSYSFILPQVEPTLDTDIQTLRFFKKMYIKVLYFTFNYVYKYVHIWSKWRTGCAHRGWERALSPLELELELVMSLLMCALGMCPLQEHSVLLITDPSLQPQTCECHLSKGLDYPSWCFGWQQLESKWT